MKSIFFAVAALLLPTAAIAESAPLTSKRPILRPNTTDIIAEVILQDVQEKFAANHGCTKKGEVCHLHTKK